MGNGQVFVKNTNDMVHVDAFDGEEFVFPPGKAVLVPMDAARHMLGYDLKDKTETLVRLGWATKYDPVTKAFTENPDGVRRLAKFVFEEAVTVGRSSLAAALPAAPVNDGLEIA